MSENLHNIDKLFRDGIEGQEDMPSPHVWNELDKKLDKKKVDSITGKYYKLKWVAAALLIFSFGMGMYVYHVRKNSELVKTNGNIESASKNYTGKKHADAALESPGMTAESKNNIASEKPAVPPAKMDSLQTKLPAAAPVVKSELPDGAAHAVNEKEKLRDDSGQKEAIHVPVPQNHSLTIENHRRGQRSDAVNPKKTGEEKSTLVNNASRRSRITDKQGDLTAINGKRQKDNKKYPVQSVEKETRQKDGTPLQSNKPDLHAAIVFPELIALHPGKITAWKSPSSLADPVHIANIPLGKMGKYIKLSQTGRSGFTATILFSPNAVSNNVASTNSSINNRIGPPRMGQQNYPQAIKDKEQNGSSWSAGALLAYNFKRSWSIESGLVLTTRNTFIEPKTITAHPDDYGNIKYLFDCSSGFLYIDLKQNTTPSNGDTATAVSSKNRLQYLSVPVVMKYSFGHGKLQVSTGFGLQTNFQVSHKIDTYVSRGNYREYANTGEIQGLRPVYISGLLNAGISYKLSSVFTGSITPNAQIGLMSINGNAPVKSYINFYGIAAGISIKL